MIVMETVAAVLAALLAVVGLYALVAWATVVWLVPRGVTAAVILRREDGEVDAAMLDILLGEAVRSPVRRRGEAVLLLVSPEFLTETVEESGRDGTRTLAPELCEIVAKYGATVLVVPDL